MLSITGSSNMSLLEANDAAKYIYEVADPDAQIIFGVGVDEDLEDSIKVTVIATGFDSRNPVTVNPGRPKSKFAPTVQDVVLKPLALDDIDLPTFLRKERK